MNTNNNTFEIRHLMSWNKVKNGELAVMNDMGQWVSFRQLPKYLIIPNQYEDMSPGYSTMQILLKLGWILVNKDEY